MRVHLRGVVIAVAVLLSLVVVVSVFNAYDSKPARRGSGRMAGRQNRQVGGEEDEGDEEDEEGAEESRPARERKNALKARSRNLPRSNIRLTDTRTGGPRSPGARAGGARAGGIRGMAARASAEEEGEEARPMPRGRVGARARQQQEQSEDMEEPLARPRPGMKAKGLGAPGARAAGGAARGVAGRAAEVVEEMGVTPKKRGRKKPKAEEDDDEEGEGGGNEEGETTEKKKRRKKREPDYPDWWKTSYPRSAVSGKEDEFVGDKPLFDECPVFESGGPKMQRFGYIEPQNYMANSKNPCWFEFNGKKDMLKCVPYFYVAGVPKSATADLMNRIRSHPQVVKGSTIAYHWWDRQRYGAPAVMKYTKEAKRPEDPMPLKEYTKQIVESGGKNVTRELLYKGESKFIFGDGSPTYLVENTQWTIFEGNEGCNEPRVLPASFIRHMFPDSRIIVTLRHPVVRLYSRFLAKVPPVPDFENRTSSLFHTFCVQAVQMYKECFARASIRQCAYNATLFSNAVVRLSEGMYSIFLEDWFRIFPRDQILILRYEDYVADIPGTVSQVFDFLGLEKLDPYSMMKIAEIPLIRKGQTPEQAGHMLPETVELLNSFYAPFLAKLAYMLDDEKWLFNDVTIMTSHNLISTGPTAYVPPGHRAIGGQTMPTQTEKPPKGEQAQADIDAERPNPEQRADAADEDTEAHQMDNDLGDDNDNDDNDNDDEEENNEGGGDGGADDMDI